MEEWIRRGGSKRVDAFGKPDDAFLEEWFAIMVTGGC